MNILYLIDQMYLHGGGERVLTNKANYLIENCKAEVHIITSEQKGNPPCYKINPKVTFNDLKVNYNRSISYFSLSNLIKAPSHYYKLKKIIHKINPDVIVTLSTQYDYYFLPFLYKKITKVKEFHSSRHFNYSERKQNKSFFKRVIYKINDYIESKYDYLAILNKDEKKYYNSNNLVIIPNALTNIKPPSKLINKRVISAGRIAPVKGFERLISAWKYVIEKCPDWTLEIYGDGEIEYIKELKIQINTLDLNNHIFLKGSTQDLENEMKKSSIYVMSSLTECFPMVLLEAMSVGLPIVSFDCPNGPRNIIKNNEDGLLIDVDNCKSLAKGIICLIKNPDKRRKMGKNAHQNVQRFSETNIMSKWLTIFQYHKI